jgi:dihydroorotate dehydrogenase
MHQLIVSAPFGGYLRASGWTSTLGTFTVQRRAGFWKRWWRVLSTVRPYPRLGGWVNRLGLPNPGVRSLHGQYLGDCILSVHGFTLEEWTALGWIAAKLCPLAVEANLSCPNVQPATVTALVDGCLRLQGCGRPVIAKLPPVRWMDFARPLHANGVRVFHLCNTLPTPAGGLSGLPLMPLALWAVEEVRQAFGADVRIIGGGGVTCAEDVDAYLAAGANHVAVGSAFLNPFRWHLLRTLPAYLLRRS